MPTVSGASSQMLQAVMASSQSAKQGSVQDQISMKVLKDSADQKEAMIQKLIVNAPQPAAPKSANSTFEMLM